MLKCLIRSDSLELQKQLLTHKNIVKLVYIEYKKMSPSIRIHWDQILEDLGL
jgi:hypothetical protein